MADEPLSNSRRYYHGSTWRPTFEALDEERETLDDEAVEDEHRVSSLHFDLDDDEL